MEKNKTVSGLKKQLAAAIAMVLVAAISLGTSTYAWFVNNTKVTAGTTKVSATTANTLLIKNENNEWATTYTFDDTNTNFVPVSTIGKGDATAFDFFTQNNWAKDTSNAITVNKVSNATAGSYWTKDFEIKASQACKLYLDTDTKFETAGAGNTMNKVLRLALVVKDSNDNWKKTVMYQIDPEKNTGNTYNTTLEALSADGINNAISGFETTGEGNSTTAGTAQAGALVSPATKQIGSSTSRDYALATAGADNSLAATVGSADELYDFTQNNEVVKITAYIWMEGCDYDCNNNTVATITGAANTVTATLGFCAGSAN
ncbi:MAG: hypothetical protein SOT10_05200 [Oscillospiraceae bacterium]|nr:hypothetical protein [Oscillospiraceae bacterium]